MTNFKFTGVNIAATLLILAFFFPWFTAMGTLSLSGFSIITTGISPGLFAMVVKGMNRLFMMLIVVVHLSGALILYQNISGNKNFDKYYKPAQLIPGVLLVLGLVMLYFKMQLDAPVVSNEDYGGYGDMMRHVRKSAMDMAPGLFDVLGAGVYISLIASVYLLLVSIGKLKDKEYFKTAVVNGNVKQEGNNNNPASGNLSQVDTNNPSVN